MKKGIILGVIGLLVVWMLIAVYTGDSEGQSQGTSDVASFGATLLAAVYVGFLFIAYILPIFTNKVANMVFSDSGEDAEPDILSVARGLVARGEYDEAIASYNSAIAKEPDNRLAWTDIAKIYADKLNQPEMAVATYQRAAEAVEWQDDDSAFFLFRISEWQADELNDSNAAVATLEEIIKKFPETRHSANAMNQLSKLKLAEKHSL